MTRIRRTMHPYLSACFACVLLSLRSLAIADEGPGISNEEMKRAIIKFEECVKRDKTPVDRPLTPVCGVPAYYRETLEDDLRYPQLNDYKAKSSMTTSPAEQSFFFRRNRGSEIVVVLERKGGRVVVVGIGKVLY